jgi:hypothetical protein
MPPANNAGPAASGRCSHDVSAGLRQLYLAWRTAEARLGPQRAYRDACRLADALRPHGRQSGRLGDWARAYTLFWRGRFVDARTLLDSIAPNPLTAADAPGHGVPDPQLLLPALQSWSRALDGAAATDDQLAVLTDAAYRNGNPAQRACASHALGLYHCLRDRAEDCLAWSRVTQEQAIPGDATGLHALAQMLEYWACSRLRLSPDETGAQRALAELRRLGPAQEARGVGLYAQAAYRQSPGHAETQLDAALQLNARCGLHLWDARLLYLKSRSLDAAGRLAEADRFLRMAQAIAVQQDARLFLADMSGIESRTPERSTREAIS